MTGAQRDPGENDDAGGRLRVGEETPPGESPCPGCGAYYFALHEPGCEFEQCAVCEGQLVACGGHPIAQKSS
jgi:hypothetical protein